MNARQRTRLYGPPCDRGRFVPLELFGVQLVAHQLVAAHLVETCRAAHRALAAAGALDAVPRRIDSFACRRIRHDTAWSVHAWALAFDIFRTGPGVPPPGGVWTPTLELHPAFVEAFETRGWTWGGRWRRRDTPHFEWSRPPP